MSPVFGQGEYPHLSDAGILTERGPRWRHGARDPERCPPCLGERRAGSRIPRQTTPAVSQSVIAALPAIC